MTALTRRLVLTTAMMPTAMMARHVAVAVVEAVAIVANTPKTRQPIR